MMIIPPEVFHAEQESNESVQSRGRIPNIVINEFEFERDDSESPSIAEYLESVLGFCVLSHSVADCRIDLLFTAHTG